MTTSEYAEIPHGEDAADVGDEGRGLEFIKSASLQIEGTSGAHAPEVEVVEHRNAWLARMSGDADFLRQLDATRWIAEQMACYIRNGIPRQVSLPKPVRRIQLEVCYGVNYWHYGEQYFAPEGLTFVPGVPALDSRRGTNSAQSGFRIWADDQMVLLAGCVSVRDDSIEVHVGFTPLCLTVDYPTVERFFTVQRSESFPHVDTQNDSTRALGLYALLSVTSWMQGFGSHLPLYLSLLAEAAHHRLALLLRRGTNLDHEERLWLSEIVRLAGDEQPETVDGVLLAPLLEALAQGDEATQQE